MKQKLFNSFLSKHGLLDIFPSLPESGKKGIFEDFIRQCGCTIDQIDNGEYSRWGVLWTIWTPDLGFIAYKLPVEDAIKKFFDSSEFDNHSELFRLDHIGI